MKRNDLIKNNTFIVALVSIFIIIFIVLFSFPSVFLFFFGTTLGIVLLVLFVIALLLWFDYRWAILIGSMFIILYRAFTLSSASANRPKSQSSTQIEPFSLSSFGTKNRWSDDLKKRFIEFENTYNPTFQFDISIIEKQASPEEVEFLLINKKWPWSEETKTMYFDAVRHNIISNVEPGVAVDIAQTIYNEKAAKELLSWNTKEGNLLIYGVTTGHTRGLPDSINNIVKCGKKQGSKSSKMQQITFLGYDGINGDLIKNIKDIDDKDIPSRIRGFKFVDDACNPCSILDNPNDYSCPFSINVGDGGEISSVWKNLWGLDDDTARFPVYAQIENEIKKAKNFFFTGRDNNDKSDVLVNLNSNF